MTTLIHRALVALAVACMSATTSFGQTVYLESDGILAIEAEAAENIPSEWRLENSVSGASGGSYLRALLDSFGTPGRGIISYHFETSSTADFQFAFNSRIGAGSSSTDHNDTWVRLFSAPAGSRPAPVTPIPNSNVQTGSGWYKVYQNTFGSWTHNASNKDNDPHSLSWALTAGERYSLQISSRSKDHLVDRLFLWDKARYNLANKGAGWGANNTAFSALPNSGVVVPEPASALLLIIAAIGFNRRPYRPAN